MADKPYSERKGGSYVVDAKTGQRKLVEATAHQSGATAQPEIGRAAAQPASVVEEASKPAPTPEAEKKGK